MSKAPLIMVIATSFLFSITAVAADVESPCKASTYSELIRCTDKYNSGAQIPEQELKSARHLEGVARQWINPEFDADSVSKGRDLSETNVSLLFTLRLGGKRSAAIDEAKSEFEKAVAHRDIGVSEARLEMMLSLYRLSHIKSEIHIEEESVQTFSKIVGQYQKRAALSPDQDVSLSVFKMALADHQLKLTALKSDEEKIYLALTALTGIPRSVISKNLPPMKASWPAIEGDSSIDSSPQVRAALADLKLARAQKLKAEGDSWPDLKIGPAMKSVKENGDSTTYVGFGLSMPIPILSQNGAARDYGNQRILAAELGATQSRRLTAATRAELVYRYNQTIQSLKSSLSLTIVNKKHAQLEKQFFRGLVPSSLVIEAHRQMFDLDQRRNTSELEALESLGRILILDNKFNEVIL